MDWRWIESKWKAVLLEKNKQLRGAGRTPISRYHATDCANLKKEFRDWNEEEQIKLTKQLIAILKNYDASTMSFTMPLDDFSEVYECKQPELQMHGFLLKCIMHQIVHDIYKAASGRPLKPFSIALVHERCDQDSDMLKAFNQVLADENFDGRKHFRELTPMGWESCIPLQAADMLAL